MLYIVCEYSDSKIVENIGVVTEFEIVEIFKDENSAIAECTSEDHYIVESEMYDDYGAFMEAVNNNDGQIEEIMWYPLLETKFQSRERARAAMPLGSPIPPCTKTKENK